MEDIPDHPALVPQARRSLLGQIVRKLDEYHHRVRVTQVTRERDLEVVGKEIRVDLTDNTVIGWIGDPTMEVGTWLSIDLPDEAPVAPDRPLDPETMTITLQNAKGEVFRP